MKKTLLRILGMIILIILYEVIGLIIPFMNFKTIENTSVYDAQLKDIMTDSLSSDRAMILESPESALEERIRLVNLAKEKIVVSTFDMRVGKSTDDFVSLLWKKANEGVKVEILIDGVSGTLRVKPEHYFEVLASHPNITLKFYNEINVFMPWKLMGRMHDKYVIVDDIGYILGGRNTFDYFLGDYPSEGKSNDREVLIYNTKQNEMTSLNELKNYFNEVWNLKDCQEYKPKPNKKEQKQISDYLVSHFEETKKKYENAFLDSDYMKRTKSTQGVHILKNPTTLYGKEPVVFYQLIELMKNASKSVTIHSPYAVFNDYMTNSLKEITKNKPVKLLINAPSNGDNIMATSDYLKNQDKVLNSGVDLYEYAGGTSYHGKSLVIDDKYAIIGSLNFDLRSVYVDTELMVIVNSREISQELLETMNKMEKDSYHVKPDGSYDLKEGQTLPQINDKKQMLWKFIGFFMQPFRFLV